MIIAKACSKTMGKQIHSIHGCQGQAWRKWPQKCRKN